MCRTIVKNKVKKPHLVTIKCQKITNFYFEKNVKKKNRKKNKQCLKGSAHSLFFSTSKY